MADLKLSMDLLDKPWKSLKPILEKALDKAGFNGSYNFPADLPANLVMTLPKILDGDTITQTRLSEAAIEALKTRKQDVTKTFAVVGKGIQINCKTMTDDLESGLPEAIKRAKKTAEDIFKAIGDLNKAKNEAVVNTQKEVSTAIGDAWAALQRQDIELQKYKIKSKINIAKRAVAVSNNAIKIIGSMGMNAKAWGMLVHELVGLVKAIKKICESFDSSFKSVQKEIIDLESRFNKLKSAIMADEKAGRVKRLKHRMSKMKNWFGNNPAQKVLKNIDAAQAKLTMLRKSADSASNSAAKLLFQTEDVIKLARKNNLPQMAKNFEKQAAPQVAQMLDAGFKLQEAYSVRQLHLNRARKHVQNMYMQTKEYETSYLETGVVTSEDLEKWAQKVGIEVQKTGKELKGIQGELATLVKELGYLTRTLKKLT